MTTDIGTSLTIDNLPNCTSTWSDELQKSVLVARVQQINSGDVHVHGSFDILRSSYINTSDDEFSDAKEAEWSEFFDHTATDSHIHVSRVLLNINAEDGQRRTTWLHVNLTGERLRHLANMAWINMPPDMTTPGLSRVNIDRRSLNAVLAHNMYRVLSNDECRTIIADLKLDPFAQNHLGRWYRPEQHKGRPHPCTEYALRT